ncbi:circadian clock protein KaiB [Roseomonas sp. KE2513]|uniref:circadian clock KaiB family protein n=1 Tax=Roseomonas sp. KE2513 TaxID=2479202 RepID=UPI0018E05365|nr:circadian clock KaiB family protein [Roseomonas sp. KE2513]MBI0539472.1 circadian clock protein KaiB [Roseomonas sp. KE2513]
MSAENEAPDPPSHRLRLFVAGSTVRSRKAIENLRRICAEQLAGQVDLEVVDIYQQPELAGRHQVIAAPTLVKMLPLPVRRIIGDLSETERVLRGLDLTPLRPPGHDAT